jgi:copper(I)-binding protein
MVRRETDIAESVECHEATIEDEVMRMQPVSHIDMPAPDTVELKPGGHHILVLGLRNDLKVGDRLQVTLTFGHSQPRVAEAEVREP